MGGGRGQEGASKKARRRALKLAGAYLLSKKSPHSILSFLSVGSILSAGSILSIGSIGSVLSIGSSGSILSIGSSGSILSIGSAGSILGLGNAGHNPFREKEEDPEAPESSSRTWRYIFPDGRWFCMQGLRPASVITITMHRRVCRWAPRPRSVSAASRSGEFGPSSKTLSGLRRAATSFRRSATPCIVSSFRIPSPHHATGIGRSWDRGRAAMIGPSARTLSARGSASACSRRRAAQFLNTDLIPCPSPGAGSMGASGDLRPPRPRRPLPYQVEARYCKMACRAATRPSKARASKRSNSRPARASPWWTSVDGMSSRCCSWRLESLRLLLKPAAVTAAICGREPSSAPTRVFRAGSLRACRRWRAPPRGEKYSSSTPASSLSATQPHLVQDPSFLHCARRSRRRARDTSDLAARVTGCNSTVLGSCRRAA